MRPDDDDVLYEDDELRAFAQLAREAPLTDGETDRIVRRLRRDGFFQARFHARRALVAAAALLLFASGALVGGFFARRGSLEDMLTRKDLSVPDRVLLLQRAGSAYVTAAQGYADATAHIDSTAVEVASRVLVGAAHAVARKSLDAGMAARLSAALQPTLVPAATTRSPVTWF